MKTKKSFTFNKLYLFAFLIPAVIMLVIFAIREIYPFGDRSFLHIDMYHQYFPFLVEFYHKLKNGESLFYSWNTGIGSNFLALYVYYLASPTNWLAIFCPEGHLMEFITYMVVIKTGLCGTTFAVYLKKHFHTDTWAILFFSTFYALSGYMAAYSWNVMWLDCIVLAPIIILALEKLVEQGDGRLYCMMLALSILSNYYLSIMICIFLVLYFIVLLAGRNPHNQDISRPLAVPIPARLQNYYVKAIIRFGVYSLLAGGIAAILLLPEVAALKFTEFSDINFPKTVKSYFSVIDMLARHCFNVTVETGLDHWPNIYCGVAAFLLLPLYIMQKKIPIREKAPKLILLAFILISYSTNVLNFIWHGLNYPDSLPARQSFLYIFLLLAMCFEAFLHIREHSGNEIMGLFLGVLAFILLCEKLITDDSFTGACFLFTGIFLICYAGLIHGYRLHQNASQILAILTFALVIAESGVNMYLTSVSTVSRSTYLANYDSYQTLTKRTMEEEDGDFFRFEKFARRTQNDAMLIGFPSASYFSSTSNALVKDFYEKYGMKSSRVYYCYDGATPITAALLANRYMLYTIDRGYDTLFSLADTEGKLYLYRNNYSLPLGFMISSDMVSSSDMATITAHHNALTGAAYDSLQPQSSDDSLEELFSQIQAGEMKNLNIIVKADVQGSVEAVKASLEKISNDEVRVRVIHGAVGAINESDVMLASTSNAIIVGFNVRPDAAARDSAARAHVDMRMYRVIYDAINEIEAAMKGMLAPKFRENVIGHAEIRQTFKVSNVGTVAGCYVTDGKIQRSCEARIVRDGIVIHEGVLASLQRFKDQVKEVASGYECGLAIEKFNDIKEGDIIEAFTMEEIPQ